MKPRPSDALVERGYRGIVIAGTGLGFHVNKLLYPALQRAVAAGVHVVMTVQTLWGYAQMYVYDTGRDLMDLGVVPLRQHAAGRRRQLSGGTDDHDEVLRRMREPVAGEITEREPHNGYLILQAGCRRRRSSSPATGSRRDGGRRQSSESSACWRRLPGSSDWPTRYFVARKQASPLTPNSRCASSLGRQSRVGCASAWSIRARIGTRATR